MGSYSGWHVIIAVFLTAVIAVVLAWAVALGWVQAARIRARMRGPDLPEPAWEETSIPEKHAEMLTGKAGYTISTGEWPVTPGPDPAEVRRALYREPDSMISAETVEDMFTALREAREARARELERAAATRWVFSDTTGQWVQVTGSPSEYVTEAFTIEDDTPTPPDGTLMPDDRDTPYSQQVERWEIARREQGDVTVKRVSPQRSKSVARRLALLAGQMLDDDHEEREAASGETHAGSIEAQDDPPARG